MFLDSRSLFVTAFVDPNAGVPRKELLTATRSSVVVVNVTVACMGLEWADTSLVGLSGTLIGARISVSNVSSYRLTAASAPMGFHSGDFAFRFGRDTLLQWEPGSPFALIWSAVAFTGPLSVGGGSVLTIAQLRACPLSRLVAPLFTRSFFAAVFAPSSLSVPDAASVACTDCVLGTVTSVGVRPELAHAPAVLGLKAPVIELRVAVTNLLFASPLRAEYFNDSEASSIAAAASGSFQGRWLTIENTCRSGAAAEVSVAVKAAFNVTYVDDCRRLQTPTGPPQSTPLAMIISTSVNGLAAAAGAAIAGDVMSVGSLQALAAFSAAGLCSVTGGTAATSTSSPSRFLLSPFVDLGHVEVVLGNIGLTILAAFLLLTFSVCKSLSNTQQPPLHLRSGVLVRTVLQPVCKAAQSGSPREVPATWRGRVCAVFREGAVWHVLRFPSAALSVAAFFLSGVVNNSVLLFSVAADSNTRPPAASGVVVGCVGTVYLIACVVAVYVVQRNIMAQVVYRNGDTLGVNRFYRRTALDRWFYWAAFPVAYCLPQRIKQTFAAFLGNARCAKLVRSTFIPKALSLLAVAVAAVPAARRTTASCAAVWFVLSTLYIGVAVYYVLKTPLMCRIQCCCGATGAAVVGLSTFVRGLAVSLGPGTRVDVDAMDTAASIVLAVTSAVGVVHAVWLRIAMSRAKKRELSTKSKRPRLTEEEKRKIKTDHLTKQWDAVDILMLLDVVTDDCVPFPANAAPPPPRKRKRTLTLPPTHDDCGLLRLHHVDRLGAAHLDNRQERRLHELIETICKHASPTNASVSTAIARSSVTASDE